MAEQVKKPRSFTNDYLDDMLLASFVDDDGYTELKDDLQEGIFSFQENRIPQHSNYKNGKNTEIKTQLIRRLTQRYQQNKENLISIYTKNAFEVSNRETEKRNDGTNHKQVLKKRNVDLHKKSNGCILNGKSEECELHNSGNKNGNYELLSNGQTTTTEERHTYRTCKNICLLSLKISVVVLVLLTFSYLLLILLR